MTAMRNDHEKGFTLVEFLVAIGISAIVLAAIYSVYYAQQKSYVVQEQVAEMQQNLRAAMYIMAREIRMAGYDPTGRGVAAIQMMIPLISPLTKMLMPPSAGRPKTSLTHSTPAILKGTDKPWPITLTPSTLFTWMRAEPRLPPYQP
jgi:prepilin-type N-terminal cleavage/methylation domain-containing protein